MVHILIYNDGQYSQKSTNVIGVFDDFDTSLIGGWQKLLEHALQPWSIRHYKKKNTTSRVLGMYYIQEWDMSSNRCVKTYFLGEYVKNNHWQSELDKYLKEHRDTCDVILQEWYDQILSGIVPDVLKQFTYEQ